MFLKSKDTSGALAYKLICHSGDYDDSTDLNFSGTFQCYLFAVKDNIVTGVNLLAADTKDERSTDWWNRGRLRSIQLRGECLQYPEYSTKRHFSLRGMLVTLQFLDFEWSSSAKDQQNNPLLEKFTFAFDAVPNENARTPFAGVLRGPAPPKACYP